MAGTGEDGAGATPRADFDWSHRGWRVEIRSALPGRWGLGAELVPERAPVYRLTLYADDVLATATLRAGSDADALAMAERILRSWGYRPIAEHFLAIDGGPLMG